MLLSCSSNQMMQIVVDADEVGYRCQKESNCVSIVVIRTAKNC